MELNYDKEVSDAHLAAAGWGMDAFNHSNPFESHVIYVRDYRSDNTRLFTIRQDEFDVIRVPAHQPIEVMTSVIARLGGLRQSNSDIPPVASCRWCKRASALNPQYLPYSW